MLWVRNCTESGKLLSLQTLKTIFLNLWSLALHPLSPSATIKIPLEESIKEQSRLAHIRWRDQNFWTLISPIQKWSATREKVFRWTLRNLSWATSLKRTRTSSINYEYFVQTQQTRGPEEILKVRETNLKKSSYLFMKNEQLKSNIRLKMASNHQDICIDRC